MSRVEQKIIELLKTNTGIALCDSGGDSGRHWQRNKEIYFENTPRVEFDIFTDREGNSSIDFSVNLYHYLSEILEINDTTDFLNKQYSKWWDSLNDDDDCDISLFIKYIQAKSNQKHIENVYNYEYNVNQVFTYYIFEFNSNIYAIISIHNGADVRGGYTPDYIFELNGYLTGNVDVYGKIDNIDVSNTYNGYSLTDENGNEVIVTKDSDINLDFYVINEVYMYE